MSKRPRAAPIVDEPDDDTDAEPAPEPTNKEIGEFLTDFVSKWLDIKSSEVLGEYTKIVEEDKTREEQVGSTTGIAELVDEHASVAQLAEDLKEDMDLVLASDQVDTLTEVVHHVTKDLVNARLVLQNVVDAATIDNCEGPLYHKEEMTSFASTLEQKASDSFDDLVDELAKRIVAVLENLEIEESGAELSGEEDEDSESDEESEGEEDEDDVESEEEEED
jgi:hypothetical protein